MKKHYWILIGVFNKKQSVDGILLKGSIRAKEIYRGHEADLIRDISINDWQPIFAEQLGKILGVEMFGGDEHVFITLWYEHVYFYFFRNTNASLMSLSWTQR
ncbi:hypothetical protein ACJX0J_030497 [Zea mays]